MQMLATIRKSLSLKVSITLAIVAIPLMALAAWLITAREARSLEELTVAQGKLAATMGAKMYGTILEDAIDNGYLVVGEVFDQNYQEIKGYDFGAKHKFHTKYDSYTDRAVLAYQDRILDNSIFVYAVGADINGYVPTHNGKNMKPFTGDVAVDQVANRTKRIFNNPVELAGASNKEPILVQFYLRDTGVGMWDVASPIFVKGKQWGGFRVGVSIVEIEKRTGALVTQLAVIFTILSAAMVGLIFVLIKRSMRPLESLSATALDMSTGEGLDTPIKPSTTDEVGRMAKSIDRLRVSLAAAMARLGE
jgi:HAMP domain-containing protein